VLGVFGVVGLTQKIMVPRLINTMGQISKGA